MAATIPGAARRGHSGKSIATVDIDNHVLAGRITPNHTAGENGS
jgi:hypothetical protein